MTLPNTQHTLSTMGLGSNQFAMLLHSHFNSLAGDAIHHTAVQNNTILAVTVGTNSSSAEAAAHRLRRAVLEDRAGVDLGVQDLQDIRVRSPGDILESPIHSACHRLDRVISTHLRRSGGALLKSLKVG